MFQWTFHYSTKGMSKSFFFTWASGVAGRDKQILKSYWCKIIIICTPLQTIYILCGSFSIHWCKWRVVWDEGEWKLVKGISYGVKSMQWRMLFSCQCTCKSEICELLKFIRDFFFPFLLKEIFFFLTFFFFWLSTLFHVLTVEWRRGDFVYVEYWKHIHLLWISSRSY